jgi:hypothetical protein
VKVREEMTSRLAEGFQVVGFHRGSPGNPYYILERGAH